MRKRTILPLVIVLLVALAGCSDPTTSEEYMDLEQELAASVEEVASLQEELAAKDSELMEAETALDLASSQIEGSQVPAEVAAVLDGWYEANNRRDGSVVDLYKAGGYHHDGTTIVYLSELADHFLLPSGWEATWTTDPYLIVDDGDGRYVVTRGMHVGTETSGYTSAMTFEIETDGDAEPVIVHSAWSYAH